MDKNNRKRLFKTKVIAKLFGQADEDDYPQDLPDDYGDMNIIDTGRTPPHLVELQAPDAKVYGVHNYPAEHKQENYIKIDKPASVSSISSDEDSKSSQILKKRKRRGRHGHAKSGKSEQHPTSSSNDTTKTSKISCHTEDHLPVTCSSLTKNQKRKLKKKQKKKEKKAQGSSCIEFTFDLSALPCQ